MSKFILIMTFMFSSMAFSADKNLGETEINILKDNMAEGYFADLRLVRNLLSGDMHVTDLQDPLCFTRFLTSSRFMADAAMQKELTGFRIVQPVNSKSVQIYATYNDPETQVAMISCLVK